MTLRCYYEAVGQATDPTPRAQIPALPHFTLQISDTAAPEAMVALLPQTILSPGVTSMWGLLGNCPLFLGMMEVTTG